MPDRSWLCSDRSLFYAGCIGGKLNKVKEDKGEKKGNLLAMLIMIKGVRALPGGRQGVFPLFRSSALLPPNMDPMP